jgi:hypothetical protein
MKTIIFLSVASTGLLSDSILVGAICLGLAFYLLFKWELKKTTKIERSEDSFQKVMDKECDCKNPCNEHCANSKTFKI